MKSSTHAYRLSIEFLASAGTLLDERLRGARLSALKHLDEASTSVVLNIAEGNGKRSPVDRARILDIARGSALESAACLDVLVAESGWNARMCGQARTCWFAWSRS